MWSVSEDGSVDIVTKKKCTGCGEILPLVDFGRNRTTRDGLSFRCKACECLRDRLARRKAKDRKAKEATPEDMPACLEVQQTSPIEAKKERQRLAVRKCRAKKLGPTESDAKAMVGRHMLLSCCTRQEQTLEETTTARKNFLSTSLKLLASDIVSTFPAVNMSEFDEILRKVSQ